MKYTTTLILYQTSVYTVQLMKRSCYSKSEDGKNTLLKVLTTEDVRALSSLKDEYLSVKVKLDEVEEKLSDLGIRKSGRKLTQLKK